MRLFMRVEGFQSKDGQTVDDKPRRLRVKWRNRVLLDSLKKQPIDLLHKIVAALVQPIDGALYAGDGAVGSLRVAGVILAVPQIEVGTMLLQDQVLEGRGRERVTAADEVPLLRGPPLQAENVLCLQHARARIDAHQRMVAGFLPRSNPSQHDAPHVASLRTATREATLESVTDRGVNKVLIYRLGSLGDMLIALPALHLIARAYPEAERYLLTNSPVHAKAPPAAAVLDGTGLVGGYLRYTAGTRSVGELFRLWWTIRRLRPEVLVYLAAARGVGAAKRDARFFRLCGVKKLIGVPVTEAMQANFRGADPQSIEAQQQLDFGDVEPEAARLVRNLHELGDGALEQPESWDLHLSEGEKERAAHEIGETALQTWPVAVSVGTKVQAKDWGRENWQALLTRLATEMPGRGLLLLGAPEESEASAFAARHWEVMGGGPVVNLCGRLTPRESAAAIARASLFLGHDSGPMHLAAAVGTPLVAIFAARNIPRQWFPCGTQFEVVYHRVDCWGCGLEMCLEQGKKCLVSISVEEVLAKIHLLRRRVEMR